MGGMGGGTQAGIFPRGEFTIPLGRARFLLALGLIGDGSYFSEGHMRTENMYVKPNRHRFQKFLVIVSKLGL